MKILRAIKIFFFKWGVRTFGKLSDGLFLCQKYGLTSGIMLEYIYRNKPSGKFWIGKVVDRRFLSDPGWEAVRMRRRNLELLLEGAISARREAKQETFILDIASGPAGYVRAVLKRLGGHDIKALCRDYDSRWVDEGRKYAAEEGLKNVIFEKGDAFNTSEFEKYKGQPNIILASGFYDWISDDSAVRKSIGIVAATLANNGCFIVTNQSAHPDQEMAQKVFSGLDLKPLEMKMRPASQIEEWLRSAGLNVEKTIQDDKGFYSVSLARRI